MAPTLGTDNASKAGFLRSAHDDLFRRTLSRISTDLGRLIYLASTRDYNSGTYHHEGLCSSFGAEAASDALRTAHREVFSGLASLSLEELVEELDAYVQSSHESCQELLHAWRELEPYRVAIPMDADPVLAQLFISNIRLSLEVLRIRRKRNSSHPLSAWRLP
jgi:hypothetical protein